MQSFLREFRRQIKTILHSFSFPQPFHLINEVERIKKRFKVKPATPGFCNFNELLSKLYLLWNLKGKEGLTELTYKEKKCLPWILYTGESDRIIEKSDLLKAILELFTPPKSFHVNAFIHVYLKNFEFSEGNEILREFILNYLKAYNGKRQSLQRWKSKINFLFTKDAVSNTGSWILSRKDEYPDICLEELGLTSDLANSQFIKHVILFCLKATERDFKFLSTLLHLLESPENSSVRFPEILPEVATNLIPKAEFNVSKKIQESLYLFFIKHLGDPRLPGGKTRWQYVSEDARKIFIQWLSEKDIEFFFDVVGKTAKDSNWRYRRKFWEAYLPHIEGTWAVLGSKAANLAKGAKYRFGRLKGGASDQSIFLIKMGGHIFVEWSHSGACRVYEKSEFPWEFGSEIYSVFEILYSKPKHKQKHTSSRRYRWQDELASWIFSNLDIKPARSYHLGQKI